MRTRRLFHALSPLLAALVAAAGCSHSEENATADLTLASVDIVTIDGEPGNLAFAMGKVVVIDVCAAFEDVCLINAKAMDEACEVVCEPDKVEFISLLLDDTGPDAARSYKDVLGVRQRVMLPGPRTRAGQSKLGPITGIPLVYIYDQHGHLKEGVQGAVLRPAGIIEAVRELLQ